MSSLPESAGLLILPHLRIQNANAISSPLTHGFPSITAFLGLMWAMERKLAGRHSALFDSVGVICHDFQEQVTEGGYTRAFRLTRNPVGKDGSTAGIVEEGRIHLDITLVFGIGGDIINRSDGERDAFAREMGDIVSQMRVAGGSVLPSPRAPWQTRSRLVSIPQDAAVAAKEFRYLRRRWLPGFALVCRDDLLRPPCRKATAQRPRSMPGWISRASTGGPTSLPMPPTRPRAKLKAKPRSNGGTTVARAGSCRYRSAMRHCPSFIRRASSPTRAIRPRHSASWKACIPSGNGSARIAWVRGAICSGMATPMSKPARTVPATTMSPLCPSFRTDYKEFHHVREQPQDRFRTGFRAQA